MQQRLAIASALLSDPEVMILDEPTNGLDQRGIAEMRELIIELAAENRTIILASHLLDEVQKICSHFAVLRSGKKIFQGSVKDLDSENVLVEIRSEEPAELERVVMATDLIAKVNRHLDVFEIQLKETATVSELHRYLIDNGVVLNLLRPQPNKLEKKFLEVLREGRDD
jgi:ABC-2 type transport system ATP-binding protein